MKNGTRAFGKTAVVALLLLASQMIAGCSGGGAAEGPAVRTGPVGRSVTRIQKAADEVVAIAGAGDVNLGDGVTPYLTSQGVDYPWADASEVFSLADLSFVNLECCLAYSGSPVPGKEFTFRGPPDAAAGISRAGVDVLSLANNHSLDFGAGAFLETLDHLAENGVAWCGAGRNEGEAYRAAVLTAKGKKVGFVAFSGIVPDGWPATSDRPGCATAWDRERVAASVRRAAEESDYVVASFHWGVELATSPGGEQVELAHLAVDSGADLVLGHHPHVVQGFELYENRLIAYSLGNFVFSPPREISAKSVAVVAVLGPRGLVQARIVPMLIMSCRPVLLNGDAATEWVDTIKRYTGALGTEMAVREGRGFINGAPPGK